MKLDSHELPHIIVGASMEVHRALGPGLSLSAYQECLAHELRHREILFQRDYRVEVCYKDKWVDAATAHFLVEEKVLVEVCDRPLDESQKLRMRNLLRLMNQEVGLLINFNAADLRAGIKRIIVSREVPALRYR